MGNCCSELYAVFSQSEYEIIVDANEDRCRGYSNVTNSTYHSDIFPQEDSELDPSIFPPQFNNFYQIGGLVGVGTTSKVYKVHSKLNKKTIGWNEESLACKIIDKQKIVCDLEVQDVDSLLDQLSKEVDILKRIKHHNIVQFYDYMESKDRLFIITERLDGGELFEHILDNGPLSEDFARQILFGVFQAVSYLHERGVVHRDIKAENLIFFKNIHGETALKLIDFGFSTVLRHSMTGSFMGTGGYIAPEIRQNKIYSTSVDSWSLGVLLYCTLAARLPFGISLHQLPGNIKECRGAFELVFPAKPWANISSDCKDLISKLLEIDPNRRFTVKEALSHPWFQAEYRRAKHQEALRPTRSLSSDMLAEYGLAMELPMLRPHLRPTLSMTAIERRGGQFGAFKCERTTSLGEYEFDLGSITNPSTAQNTPVSHRPAAVMSPKIRVGLTYDVDLNDTLHPGLQPSSQAWGLGLRCSSNSSLASDFSSLGEGPTDHLLAPPSAGIPSVQLIEKEIEKEKQNDNENEQRSPTNGQNNGPRSSQGQGPEALLEWEESPIHKHNNNHYYVEDYLYSSYQHATTANTTNTTATVPRPSTRTHLVAE